MTEASQAGRAGTEEAGDAAADATTTGSDTPDESTTAHGTTADAPAGTADGPAGSTETRSDAPTDENDDDVLADHEDKAYKSELRKGLLVGVGGGLLVGLVVSMLLGAFVWPGYLLSPGSPDDVAAQATAALSNKDGTALDAVTCKGPDGPTSQIPPSALQLIARATQPGPPRQTLDTEARAPLDLVISEQGQTQQLPSDMVLGVNNGSWCLAGLAQRQQ